MWVDGAEGFATCDLRMDTGRGRSPRQFLDDLTVIRTAEVHTPDEGGYQNTRV